MHRRTFLRGIGAGLLAGAASGAGMRLAWSAPDGRNGRALVVVSLRGGCDGLNVVVPYGEDAYHAARPTVGIRPPGPGDPAAALDLDGFFGLHPALGPLHRRYQEGMVALLPTVQIPNGRLSHFASQAAMEQAGGGNGDGWLGRYLAGTSPDTRAAALDSAPPLALHGIRPVAAYPDPFDVRLASSERNDADLQRVLQEAYVDVSATGNGRDPWGEAAELLLADRARRLAADPPNVASLEGPFEAKLAAAAQLLTIDPDIAVVTLNLGGWDTHHNQGGAEGYQAASLGVLARGLDVFVERLGARRNEVVVLVQTEFGRTLAENASRGTDHGLASTWIAIGGSVRGGIYPGTGWPGLGAAQLDRGRYLAGTIDYRDVYAEVLAGQLGALNLESALPGHAITPLGMLA